MNAIHRVGHRIPNLLSSLFGLRSFAAFMFYVSKNAAVFLCLQQNPRVRNSVYRPVYTEQSLIGILVLGEFFIYCNLCGIDDHNSTGLHNIKTPFYSWYCAILCWTLDDTHSTWFWFWPWNLTLILTLTCLTLIFDLQPWPCHDLQLQPSQGQGWYAWQKSMSNRQIVQTGELGQTQMDGQTKPNKYIISRLSGRWFITNAVLIGHFKTWHFFHVKKIVQVICHIALGDPCKNWVHWPRFGI